MTHKNDFIMPIVAQVSDVTHRPLVTLNYPSLPFERSAVVDNLKDMIYAISVYLNNLLVLI